MVKCRLLLQEVQRTQASKNAKRIFFRIRDDMSSRKQPVTTIESAARVVRGMSKDIQPPAHITLDDCDLPFWRSVVAEFARADWTEHQLELAALLSRTMSDMATEQKTLRSEGFIAVRENGTTVENPRARVCKSLAGDILSLRRSLALHARGRAGDNRDAGTQKVITREIEMRLTSGADEHGLLN